MSGSRKIATQDVERHHYTIAKYKFSLRSLEVNFNLNFKEKKSQVDHFHPARLRRTFRNIQSGFIALIENSTLRSFQPLKCNSHLRVLRPQVIKGFPRNFEVLLLAAISHPSCIKTFPFVNSRQLDDNETRN